MKLELQGDLHIHIHQDSGKVVEEVLKSILNNVIINQKNDHEIMQTLKDLQAQNVALIAAVKDETDVEAAAASIIESQLVTLTDLQAQLVASKDDPAAIDALATSLGNTIATVTASKAALAKAVADGTPAAAPPADNSGAAPAAAITDGTTPG